MSDTETGAPWLDRTAGRIDAASSMSTGSATAGEYGRASILDELAAIVPERRLLTDPDLIASLSSDQAHGAPVGRALAVFRAESAAEVQGVVQACLRHRVPVVARGAGTGLSDGANAVDGGVVVCLDRMDSILEIDPVERIAVIEAGVVNDDLRAAAAAEGLWYPPDPSSAPWATIGGNVATNAGGLCRVKYGVTRDYVLALQVVTGTGELVSLGRRTAKGVAGYDLAGLFVGSEGTLGIVTQVTVRLRPPPPPAITVIGFFPSIALAGKAVSASAAGGLTPSMLELMDRHTLRAIDAWKNMGLAGSAEAILLARFDDAGTSVEQAADGMLKCFDSAGASWSARSTDEQEAEELFAARRLAYPALERLGAVLTEDVCVPKAQIPRMVSRIEEAADRLGLTIATVAHAGDGNLHPMILIPHEEPDAAAQAYQVFDDIIAAALEVGGTVTGEHGVGLLKKRGLQSELSPAVLAMHHAVKNALDPAHILNPG